MVLLRKIREKKICILFSILSDSVASRIRFKTLERVQRRAAKTKESHHLPYENILERLVLTDMKTRRERKGFIYI